jgi:hypothetical protein
MKVISFCLWGNDPKYCTGAIKNAKIAAQLYPDWECWFYLPVNGDIAPHNNLVVAGVELMRLPNVKVLQSERPGNWTMMLDRFLPADKVEVMISRDCDSRLSQREKEAVDEWLASPKGFHIMRDHPWHGTKILGGMFGIKQGCLSNFSHLLDQWRGEDRWQTDQDFLASEIYPRIVNDVFVHDSFFNSHIEDIHPFPSLRNGLEFVGQVFDENDATVSEHQEMLRRYLR